MVKDSLQRHLFLQPRDIVDSSGVVKDSITYDGFGNITAETNASYRGRYAWTGREIDVETSLQYNRARYYDSTTGRWISQDPLGFDAGDSNLYRYVNNRPTVATDPSGNLAIAPVVVLAATWSELAGVLAVTSPAAAVYGIQLGPDMWDSYGMRFGQEEFDIRQRANQIRQGQIEVAKWNATWGARDTRNDHPQAVQQRQLDAYNRQWATAGQPQQGSLGGGNTNHTSTAEEQRRRNAACFAAGTKLLSPNGPKVIEDFKVGDPIISRNECEPSGALEVKAVEEIFRRSAPILHLHVAGRIIRTTGEHPFFAFNKGWVNANELAIGDLLLTEDGQWVPVEDVLDTGEWEVVYNLRIADYHTYFVTDWDWGFSVWSHNACVALTRYTVPPGWPSSARHWSVQVTMGNVSVNTHQTNDTTGMPSPTDSATVWAQWHPQAHIESLTVGAGVPGMTIDKTKTIQVTDAQAQAAQAFVALELAKAPYPYDIYTASCAAYVGDVLIHAGISVPAHPTGALSAGRLVTALNTIVDS